MDKDVADHRIDPGLQIGKPTNIKILKEQTNKNIPSRAPRAQLAAANGSEEERVDGRGCLGDQVKSAYD
jgi:hypothetical protein